MPSGATSIPALTAAGGSHAGLKRENNEDRFHCDPQRGIFVVVDGVGGHAAGEKAADTALDGDQGPPRARDGRPARPRPRGDHARQQRDRPAGGDRAGLGGDDVRADGGARPGRPRHCRPRRRHAPLRCAAKARSRRSRTITRRSASARTRANSANWRRCAIPRRNEIYRDVGSQVRAPARRGVHRDRRVPVRSGHRAGPLHGRPQRHGPFLPSGPHPLRPRGRSRPRSWSG